MAPACDQRDHACGEEIVVMASGSVLKGHEKETGGQIGRSNKSTCTSDEACWAVIVAVQRRRRFIIVRQIVI